MVHSSDHMPFPEDEGILAVPGKLTNVAMKRVSVLWQKKSITMSRLSFTTIIEVPLPM